MNPSAGSWPVRASQIQPQGVNARDQRWPQRALDGAVGINAAKPQKRCRPQPDMKMRFAPFTPARMTTMFFAVITHIQRRWGKGRTQFRLYFIRQTHFFALPPSKPRQNT